MDGEEEERRRKKAKIAESKEYDRILQTIDHNDHHDLAAHLLLAAHHRAKQRQLPKDNKDERRIGRPRTDGALVIHDRWTAWPLPASLTPRPTPIPSSSSTGAHNKHDSDALHAEIEAAILRIARKRIHDEGGTVSANEHAPYHVTRQITSNVITRFNRLLNALGRVKYQQIDSKRIKSRQLKSRWDEIVTIAGIPGIIDSPEVIARIKERCNKLFKEEIPWSMETRISKE
jgi:hypothetical protein